MRLLPVGEQALLGAILVNNDAYYRVSDFLLPDHFFEPVHARIFACCTETRPARPRSERVES